MPEEVKRAMFECHDRFHQELEIRSKAMDHIVLVFYVIQPNSLVVATEEEFQKCIPKLTKTFDEFSDEDISVEIG